MDVLLENYLTNFQKKSNMALIEIFKQKFEKMVDSIPASVDSAGYVIDEVYKILDSLKDKIPADLEEAARKYSWWCLEQHGEYVHEDPYECFKAGAEWKKAKMMKNAVETQILTTSFVNLPKEYLHQNGIQAGDKVRVIVIKED